MKSAAVAGLLLLAGCAHKPDLPVPDPGWVVEVARIGASKESGTVRVSASIRNTRAEARFLKPPVSGSLSIQKRNADTGELEFAGGELWGYVVGCEPGKGVWTPVLPGRALPAAGLEWEVPSTAGSIEVTLDFYELREGQCLRHSLVGVLRLDPGASKAGESSP